MDTRNEILTNVLAVMSSIITGVALDQLQSVLVSELAKYEVQERCTDCGKRRISRGITEKVFGNKTY